MKKVLRDKITTFNLANDAVSELWNAYANEPEIYDSTLQLTKLWTVWML